MVVHLLEVVHVHHHHRQPGGFTLVALQQAIALFEQCAAGQHAREVVVAHGMVQAAQMFLIFNLLRPDVLPLDDIGLQKAVATLYFADQRPSRRQLAELGERWRPWRSVATWYLWRSLDPVPVEY